MVFKIYNTLANKKEEFKSSKKKINAFCCGITSYNHAHIGHAKSYTQFDLIIKYLKYKKFNIFYLQNITDLDDKIIKSAKEEKTDWKTLARRYEKSYLEDMKILGNDSVDKYARATDYIPQIVSQVKRLIKKGYVYEINDGFYYNVKKFKDYGKLSGRTIVQAEDGVSRIDENKEKKNKADFCVWKFSKPGEPIWQVEDFKGRPGWHIEDTAITEKELGEQYDLHAGAVDLIFPHHEAEISLMESISGKKPFVKHWTHMAFLNMKKEKMSKSKGNFITIKKALEKWDPKTLRCFFLSNHYRTPLEYSEETINHAKNSLERLQDFVSHLQKSKEKDNLKLIEKTKKDFFTAMDNDLDTPKAFAILFNFVREVNKSGGSKKSLELIKEIDSIFNILDFSKKSLDQEIKKLIDEREKARKDKDFNKADKIRDNLKKKGIILEDTNQGVKWKKG